MASVSSANNAPVSVEVPLASAAQISARLVMLLEPGGLNSTSKGCVSGCTSTEFMHRHHSGL
ncbi:unannotated protein [freshwater metagenome]|uniref:Unannotated protein n=1 Tax=freshwater metagenome TaxID=449393 RepID=A0A6J6SKW9_9ZZZZ